MTLLAPRRGPSFSAFDSSRGGVQAPCATPLRSERGPVHTVPPVHDKEQSSDRSYPTSEPTGAGDFRGSDGFRFSPQQAQGAGSVAREFYRPSPTRKARRRQSARAHNRSAEGSVTFRHHAGARAIFFLDRDCVITRRVPHPQHPSSRRQPGEQRASGPCVFPHALADLSFAFGSHQAPAQSQAAYSYGQQQMAPNPYAMWPQVRVPPTFNRGHPAHTLAPPLLASRRKRREAGRERDHDAVAPTPAALKTDRAPFTTFQSQAMSNPYGGASQFMYPGYMVRAPAHTPRPFQNAAPWRYLSTGKSQSPTFFLTHCPPSPRSLLRFTSGCVRSRRGR